MRQGKTLECQFSFSGTANKLTVIDKDQILLIESTEINCKGKNI